MKNSTFALSRVTLRARLTAHGSHPTQTYLKEGEVPWERLEVWSD